MAEAPELEVFLHVDQLFAHLVCLPVLLRVAVDFAEDVDDGFVADVRRGPVTLNAFPGYVVTTTREIAEELVVEARRVESAEEIFVDGAVVREDLDGLGILIAEKEFELAILDRTGSRRRCRERRGTPCTRMG